MKFIQHPSNTRVMGAPETLNISDPNDPLYVAALPITDAVLAGQRVMYSFWKPDAEELAALQAGAPILLGIWGADAHPVVSLEVAEP